MCRADHTGVLIITLNQAFQEPSLRGVTSLIKACLQMPSFGWMESPTSLEDVNAGIAMVLRLQRLEGR